MRGGKSPVVFSLVLTAGFLRGVDLSGLFAGNFDLAFLGNNGQGDLKRLVSMNQSTGFQVELEL